MSDSGRMLLSWLFVLNLGVAFGAGVYEHRIVVPRWAGGAASGGMHWDPAVARADDTGRRFWGMVTTIPLTLLTLAALGAGWTSAGPVRAWWLAAGLVALAERALTFGYFIPVMVALMGASDSPESAATAARWAQLNYLRHALLLAAWMAALKTFGLLHGRA